MYFDGAARHDGVGAGAGVGVVFVSPKKHVFTYSFVITQLWSNNRAEYQALILGLQTAIEIAIKDLHIYGDSELVIKQFLEEYEVKRDGLVPYFKYALRLLNRLEAIKLPYVPRSANKMADPPTNLAATLTLRAEESMNAPVCN